MTIITKRNKCLYGSTGIMGDGSGALSWKSPAAVARSRWKRVMQTHTDTRAVEWRGGRCKSSTVYLVWVLWKDSVTDRPSTRCDWHKWVGTKESVWLSHTLIVTLTLCSASCLSDPSHSNPATPPSVPPAVALHQATLNPHTLTHTHTVHCKDTHHCHTCPGVAWGPGPPQKHSLPPCWVLFVCPPHSLTSCTVEGTVLFTNH